MLWVARIDHRHSTRRRSPSSDRAAVRRTRSPSPNGCRPISPRVVFVVVSGLARGVDSAAHRGALSVDGRTLAVLGCGVDVVYPRNTWRWRREIVANRRDSSASSCRARRRSAHFFPRRNRIISGLSRAVVVIEAGEKSGSLITARCALEQGRDVLAVPGNILNGRNRGGHALLRDGARIVETADDILEELGLAASGAGEASVVADGSTDADVAASPDADPVLACLIPGESCDLDTIVRAFGLRRRDC